MWFFNRQNPDQKILDALTRAESELSGAQLSAVTALGSGRLYPALYRLERLGKITARWAGGPYPRTRLYAINKNLEHA